MDLNFKALGQGPPLIILHGLFGMLDNWQTLAKQFAEHYSVYIIDQRNHGRSPHVEEISYPLMAADLHAFMEKQWIYEAHIMGHSMGGKTAMQFALDFPDMVDKLIVVDMYPGPNSGGHQTIFEAMFALDLLNTPDRKTADAQLSERISEWGTRQFLLKNLSRDKASGGYRWKMNLEVLHRHYEDILAAVGGEEAFEGPSLFIGGSRSDYRLNEHWSEIEELFPQAQLQMVEGAGHWVHADAPRELHQLVIDFLTDGS